MVSQVSPNFNPQALAKVAGAVRKLSIDAIEAAQSGHPGLPLGCAELGAVLYGYFLNHYPKDPDWMARDRMILSAGHGSMWLYALLHLSGFDLSLEQIKKFRQLHSQTPGHPELGHTKGVETTTGPLGQGIAHAVGQALGLKKIAVHYQLPPSLFAPKVVALAGDGCMMEGISHEACALAAHLGLDNLIVIYDANQVCLDGPLNECCSEDTAGRFRAYGWDVISIDGHALDQIQKAVDQARGQQTRPLLIMARTVIGFGAPNKAGSHEAHGAPLGSGEAKQTLEKLGLSLEPFKLDEKVKIFFDQHLEQQKKKYDQWQQAWKKWEKDHPQLAKAWQEALDADIQGAQALLEQLPVKASVATRSSSSEALNALASHFPWIVGGSADLSCSDNTFIKSQKVLSKDHWLGRNIKYGVREFAMAAIACGIAQTRLWKPFVGTFLTFSDYMKNAIRLCTIMQLPVIYQFTHDSVFLGEDGPTHQPIEHLAGLRAIPGLQVIRPADVHEVRAAWLWALQTKGPTALILSRQAVTTFEATQKAPDEGVGRGAYIIYEPQKQNGKLDWVLLASGSEVSLALEVAKACEAKGVRARVVSMPCPTLFDAQTQEYRESVLGPVGTSRVSIEAASTMGWHKYLGDKGIAIGIDHYGYSAPAKDIYGLVGFTSEAILSKMGL
jgi:transketolase